MICPSGVAVASCLRWRTSLTHRKKHENLNMKVSTCVALCYKDLSSLYFFHLYRSLRSASRTLPGVNTWCSWAAPCWPTSWKTKIPSGWAGQSMRRKAWECCKNWEAVSDKSKNKHEPTKQNPNILSFPSTLAFFPYIRMIMGLSGPFSMLAKL